MKFPLTFHGKKDSRLVCLYVDDQRRIADIEAWSETLRSWAAVPKGTLYESYVSDFKDELSESQP